MDDLELSDLLKGWQTPRAPLSLDARVLGYRRRWWSLLLTGSVRMPVPLLIAIVAALLTMSVSLLSRRTVSPAVSPVNLVDFQPARDLDVRVIRGRL